MEQARRFEDMLEAETHDAERTRFDDAAQIRRLEKVLHVAFPNRDGAAAPLAAPAPLVPPILTPGRAGARDFSQAVELVREAANFMREADSRARDTEARMHDLVERANTELKAAEQRIQAADARTRSAERRAEQAEQRLAEAEEWLGRIMDLVSQELPGRAATI